MSGIERTPAPDRQSGIEERRLEAALERRHG